MNDTTQTAPAAAQEKPVLLQPDNHNKKYEALFVEIDSGQIKLPMFQREFVWEKEQSAKLIDSILKGFPIGTFIFWKTKEELRSYKEVGNHKLPDTPKGDYAQYILDGQQRITSLYAIRKGIRITKDGKEVDYRDIFINMDYDPDTDEQIVVTEKVDGKGYVSVHDVLSKSMGTFYKTLSSSQADQVDAYKNKLTTYDFSTITIKDYPIEVACEVFSRINTGGKALTVFEIMVAKTYDETRQFDLAEKFELLRDGSDEDKECLTAAKFETVPESIIMQCVAAIILKAVRSRDILKIRRDLFIDNWEPMKASLFTAIDFIRSELCVPVSQLVPYPALLVPLTYFFNKTGNKKPTNEQVRLLEQFFYWVGLNLRYSSSTESKLAEDFNKMDSIVKGDMPSYSRAELKVASGTIAETWFSAGNAYCKAILCLLAYQQPKSFDTSGLVILDNSNLKIASSRNYHHFFPKAYLAGKDTDHEPNLIANITLIDGYSNKHRIGKKAPSKYIKAFAKDNKSISKALKTHLIDDIEEFGVSTDDYSTFIDQRARAIAIALNVKLRSITPEQAAEQTTTE
ncbi:DUF262 domain-containing protein [Hydrogenophaga sp.]|uniref:GmrSD restriction endonuclease domain-containing protein n=1 Tax=Hydrogenophaga sp. TaxID=1904254 RepID=UPI0026324BBA|nr:DUF262 domain-containing protein [Hydrogenophaga sp.]MDM7948288.1 DUF262 domain-containing protein [Hydrogenophaga sp.]